MTQQLNRLSAMDSTGGGLTLALPESEVEKLLPSLNTNASTIELSDVLNIIAQHMRGNEFYASGNPVLNRLALQSRARELMRALTPETVSQPHEPETYRAATPGEGPPAAAGGEE